MEPNIIYFDYVYCICIYIYVSVPVKFQAFPSGSINTENLCKVILTSYQM